MNQISLVHLGLGSNLGNREAYLRQACDFLQSDVLSEFQASSIYESEPLMNMPQPEYLNMVVCGKYDKTPRELMQHCQQIENDLERVREGRWDSRTIDIDILSFGKMRIESSNIRIPHPELENRSFVLLPLMELNPDWIHPVSNITIQRLWKLWQEKNDDALPVVFKK